VLHTSVNHTAESIDGERPCRFNIGPDPAMNSRWPARSRGRSKGRSSRFNGPSCAVQFDRVFAAGKLRSYCELDTSKLFLGSAGIYHRQ
ncbi:hypothetical protein, partial [Paraburkholderia sp. RL17-373-BIF-A]|uniref:hypothetical protein n=1 Tax=Paraburkholderia sp. RL17-373-BIF-A TaxID=3031629 RepID=UPI0038B952F5